MPVDVREPVAGDAAQPDREPVRIGPEGVEPWKLGDAPVELGAELPAQGPIRLRRCGQPGHVPEHDTFEIPVVGRVGHAGPGMGCGIHRQIRCVVECEPRLELAGAGRKRGQEHEVGVLPAAWLVLDRASEDSAERPRPLAAPGDAERRGDRLADLGRGRGQDAVFEQDASEPFPLGGERPEDTVSPFTLPGEREGLPEPVEPCPLGDLPRFRLGREGEVEEPRHGALRIAGPRRILPGSRKLAGLVQRQGGDEGRIAARERGDRTAPQRADHEVRARFHRAHVDDADRLERRVVDFDDREQRVRGIRVPRGEKAVPDRLRGLGEIAVKGQQQRDPRRLAHRFTDRAEYGGHDLQAGGMVRKRLLPLRQRGREGVGGGSMLFGGRREAQPSGERAGRGGQGPFAPGGVHPVERIPQRAVVRGPPGRIGEGLVEGGPLARGVEEAAPVFMGAGPEQMEPRRGPPADAGRRCIRQQLQGPLGHASP